MLLTELTIEVMRRGYRADECPRLVSNAVRMTLLYHAKQGSFFWDAEGRWVIVVKKG